MKVARDMHTHTNLSACADPATTLALLAEAAVNLEIETLGVSNHLWDNKVPGASEWYAPQDAEHVLKIRGEVPGVKAPRILVGCEAEYIGNGVLALLPENAVKFAYILVPFTHFHMKNFVVPAGITEPREIAALMLRRGLEILAHPTMNCGVPAGFAHPFCPSGCDHYEQIIESITDAEFEDFFKKLRKRMCRSGYTTARSVNVTPGCSG